MKSHVLYGCLNYMTQITKKNFNIINRAYKRGIRYAVRAKFNQHTEPIAKKLGIPQLKDVIKLETVSIIGKYLMSEKPEFLLKYIKVKETGKSLRNTEDFLILDTSMIERSSTIGKMIDIWNTLKIDKRLPMENITKLVKSELILNYQETCNINECYVCNKI